MHFDVPKVVRSPGCDHGHDEESGNGQDIMICWKYALEAIIKVLLYFIVHDNCLLFML